MHPHCFQGSKRVASCQAALGDCAFATGDIEDAARHMRSAVEHLTLLVDEDDEMLVRIRKKQERFHRTHVRSASDDPAAAEAERRLHCAMQAAMPLVVAGKPAEADPRLREALAAARDIPNWQDNQDVLNAMCMAAGNMIKVGSIGEGAALFQELREPVAKVFGEEHDLIKMIDRSLATMKN